MGRAAITALLIAALPAQADELDGGTMPLAVYGERAQVLHPDGGNWEEFEEPGAWLPLPRLLQEGRELARLRTENARLLEHVPLFSAWTWGLIGLVAALFLIGGIYLGVKLDDWLR